MRQRLTNPPNLGRDEVEQRELEGDPEAAPEIRKYLLLADIALGSRHRPYLVDRQPNYDADETPDTKRAA